MNKDCTSRVIEGPSNSKNVLKCIRAFRTLYPIYMYRGMWLNCLLLVIKRKCDAVLFIIN